MKIVTLSDTHNRHPEVSLPLGDVLVHAGDATKTNTRAEADAFLAWMSEQPHRDKLYVPGNHDWIVWDNVAYFSRQFPAVNILIHDSYVADDVLFYGCASMWGRGNLPQTISAADVLITHNAPYQILDLSVYSEDGRTFEENFGCHNILKTVQQLRPKLHLFGHIHDSGGQTHRTPNTLFANVATMDDGCLRNPSVFLYERDADVRRAN